MASRRLRNNVRISFFSFQDIITATTCILVLVTMMLSTFLGGGQTAEGYVVAATRDMEMQLKESLEKLGKLTVENEDMARRLTPLPPGGTEALKQELEKQHEELGKLLAQLDTATEENTRTERDQAERDNTHGIAATAREVQAMRASVEELTEKAAKLHRTAAELDQKVRAADSRLLAAVSAKAALWVVPDSSTTTKEPMLIVVDGAGLSMERFNKPEAKIDIRTADKYEVAKLFRAQLNRMDRLNDYLVFYIRPSGIVLYGTTEKVAREAGFEIGYDALEENRPIRFSPPPEQPEK